MNKYKINIQCADRYHLLAFVSTFYDWLKQYCPKVNVRMYDALMEDFIMIPDSQENQILNKDRDSAMYDIVESEWFSSAEILIDLNNPQIHEKKIFLLKDENKMPAEKDILCLISNSQIARHKTISPDDFKGLTAFIKKRQEVINFKKRIRKKITLDKKQFSSQELLAKSETIRKKISESPEFLAAKTILCYWSMPDEVDTHALISEWFPQKRFILPAIIGNELILKVYNGQQEMNPDPQFGILEPSGLPFENLQEIDLALIPGVAFDDQLNRLGRGKGYYDRILNLLPSSTPLWGLAFDFQKIDTVPTEEHDCKMNRVIYS